MEIVTEPDIRTAEQARRYAEELRLLMRTIGASDAEMENGQMRVEANVSIRPVGREAFGTRIEVKNMNSMKAVERAIAFEIERQAKLVDAGEPMRMETRGWDEAAPVHVPDAAQGRGERLPLLPRAGPAAADGPRPNGSSRDPGPAAGAPGGPPQPLPASARPVRVRRHRDRQRRRGHGPVRGGAGGRRGPAGQDCSPTG